MKQITIIIVFFFVVMSSFSHTQAATLMTDKELSQIFGGSGCGYCTVSGQTCPPAAVMYAPDPPGQVYWEYQWTSCEQDSWGCAQTSYNSCTDFSVACAGTREKMEIYHYYDWYQGYGPFEQTCSIANKPYCN